MAADIWHIQPDRKQAGNIRLSRYKKMPPISFYEIKGLVTRVEIILKLSTQKYSQ